MLRAIRAHMARHLGFGTRVLKVERPTVWSSSPLRTFHTLTVQSRLVRIHHLHVRLTRWQNRQRDENRLDAYLSDRGFPVPAYFGSVSSGDLVASIWEHCPGQSHKRYNAMDAVHRHATVKAMAMISARARDAQDHAEVPSGPRWIQPVAAEIDALAARWEGLGPHRRNIEYLAAHEDEVIRRLEQSGPQVLTHNDLMARNVIAMEGGQVRLIDWDSATMAPAGASLRGFVYCIKGKVAQESAEIYVAEMERHGIPLKVADVLFVMRAQQMFWYLNSGFQRKIFKRVAKGLDLFRATHPKL